MINMCVHIYISMFITFIASTLVETTGPSFRKLKRKDITCSTSLRDI